MHIPPPKPAKRNLLSAFLKKKAPPLPPRISDARRRIEMQKQAKFHLARHDALMNRIRYDDQLHARRQRQQMALQIPKRAPINVRPQPTQVKQYQPRYTPLPQPLPTRRPLPPPPTRRPDNSRRLNPQQPPPTTTPLLAFYKYSNRPRRSDSFVYHC